MSKFARSPLYGFNAKRKLNKKMRVIPFNSCIVVMFSLVEANLHKFTSSETILLHLI